MTQDFSPQFFMSNNAVQIIGEPNTLYWCELQNYNSISDNLTAVRRSQCDVFFINAEKKENNFFRKNIFRIRVEFMFPLAWNNYKTNIKNCTSCTRKLPINISFPIEVPDFYRRAPLLRLLPMNFNFSLSRGDSRLWCLFIGKGDGVLSPSRLAPSQIFLSTSRLIGVATSRVNARNYSRSTILALLRGIFVPLNARSCFSRKWFMVGG